MSDIPDDPFHIDLPGIERFPEEIQAFAREFIGQGGETIEALWHQESFRRLLAAVSALDETQAKTALLRLITDSKLRERGPAWFTAD